MISRLIKTEEDYEKALSRIEGLMDAAPGEDRKKYLSATPVKG